MAKQVNDAYWSHGDDTEPVSFVPGVDVDNNFKKFISDQNTKRRLRVENVKHPGRSDSKKKEKPKVSEPMHSSNEVGHGASGVHLKDLCLEDKQRVANLVHELAKVGEEKEAYELQLDIAEKKYVSQIKELKAEKEKADREQQALVAQYRDCQKLLAYYQNKLSEQQKELSEGISKLLSDPPLMNASRSSSGKKPSSSSRKKPSSGSRRRQRHDVLIGDLDDENVHVDQPAETFNDAQGSLGESYMQSKSKSTSCRAERDVLTHRRDGPALREALEASLLAADQCEYNSDDKFVDVLRANLQEQARSDGNLPNIGHHRPPSPHGRRDELIRQKRALEEEQAHLQRLLEEQENLLRLRQRELTKRHEEYMERMKHIQNIGTPAREEFPSVRSRPRQQQRSCGHVVRGDGLLLDTDADHVTSFDPTTTSHMTSTRGHPTQSPFAVNRDSISTPHVSDDPSRAPRSFSEPAGRSRKPWSSAEVSYPVTSPSRPATSYDVTRSTSRQTGRHPRFCSDHTSRMLDDDDDTDLYISTTRLTDVTSRVNDFHVTSPSRAGDVTSSAAMESSRVTMNNITTLSDLVEKVDASRDVSPRNVIVSSRMSGLSDVCGSTTFDPEDSAMLEEIFFIK